MQAAETKQEYKLVPVTSGFSRVDLNKNTVGFDNRELSPSEIGKNAIALTTAFAEAVKANEVELLASDKRANQYPAGIVFSATESEAAKLQEKLSDNATIYSLRADGGIGSGPR